MIGSTWIARAALAFMLCLAGALDAQAAQTPAPRRNGHPAMIDALGNTLPAGPYPRRIISLSPNLTEMLFALGVEPSRIVGRTRFCDYPPEALACPDMGGILDPSIERIQDARPDLILVARGNPVEVQEQLQALNLDLFACEDRNDLEGIARLLQSIDVLVGPDHREKADSLLQRFANETSAYRVWTAAIPLEERPRVYFADPDNPGFTAGPGSHIDDLLGHAGARNVVTESVAWPKYSTEALLLAQPEFLLIALPPDRTRDAVLKQMRNDAAWNALSAVQRGSICWVDAGTLLRPGPRLLDALEQIAACVQPNRELPRVAMAPASPGKP